MSNNKNSDTADVVIVDVEDIEGLPDWSDDDQTEQMELFASATSEHTTNTIHLYDIAPKYTYDNRERPVHESAFARRGMRVSNFEYEVEVQAARIERAPNDEVLMYPSEREEFIEDSLRKLATTGNGVFINGEAGVRFTLYQLRNELKKHGHTYSWDQLREGLYVLRRAGLKITSKKTGESWEENFLSRLVEGGSRVSEDGTRYEPWYASFHKLVTKSIIDLTYRQMNYPRLMAIKGQLARYIYKRMVSLYTFADMDKPYQPSLLQIMEESGRGMSPEMKNNIKAVNRAFDQLREEGAILKAEEVQRLRKGNKVINIRYNLYPTKALVDEIIAANRQQKALRAIKGKRRLEEIQDILQTGEEKS